MRNLLPLAALGVPSLLSAAFTAEPVPDVIADEPYRFNGRILAGDSAGSGVVATSERTVLTAAHMLFDESDLSWKSSVLWDPWGSDSNQRYPLRSFRYFSSYANAADAFGENDSRTFAHDFGVVLGYERLDLDGFAALAEDAGSALTSQREKLSVGFPSGLYYYGAAIGRQVHRAGPYSLPFARVSGDYHQLESVSMGPGASGGGIFVRDGSTWELAAIHVAGLVVALEDSTDRSGVVALGPAKKQLLAEAVADALAGGPPEFTQVPTRVIGNWDQPRSIRVEFEANPAGTVTWFLKDPFSHHGDEAIEPGWFEVADGSTTLTIPARSAALNGRELSVVVESDAGETESEKIFFRYAQTTPIRILRQPQSRVLSNNAPAVFTVEAEGFPDPPTFQWEIDREGDGTFTELENSSWGDHITGAQTDTLTMLADGGANDGAAVRVVLRGIETEIESETATIQYSDLGEVSIEVQSLPDMPIPYGATDTLEFKITGTAKFPRVLDWRIEYNNTESDLFPDPGLGGSYSLNGDNSVLQISNTGAGVNRHRIRARLNYSYYDNYGYYQSGSVRSDWIELGAEAPPRIDAPLQMDFAENETPFLHLGINSAAAPEVSWQVSWDEGQSWEPFQSVRLEENAAEAALFSGWSDLARDDAWVRARVQAEDGEPTLSDPFIPSDWAGAAWPANSLSLDLPIPEPDLKALGIWSDSILVAITTEHIQIWEEVADNAWQHRSIRRHAGGTAQVVFLSADRFLVAEPEATVGGHDLAGAASIITREPGGNWAASGLLTSPSPRASGRFGSSADFDSARLGIVEIGVQGAEALLHSYAVSGDVPGSAQTTPLGVNHFAFGRTRIDVEGDRAIIWFEPSSFETGYFSYRLSHLRLQVLDFDPDQGHWAVNAWSPQSRVFSFLLGGEEWSFRTFDRHFGYRNWINTTTWDESGQETMTGYRGIPNVDGVPERTSWIQVQAPLAILKRVSLRPLRDQLHVFRRNEGSDGEAIHFARFNAPPGKAVGEMASSPEVLAVALHDSTGSTCVSLVPMQQLQGTNQPARFGKWISAEATTENGTDRMILHGRLPSGVPWQGHLLRSFDLINWDAVTQDHAEAKVAASDADGDAKATEWAFRVPIQVQGQKVYYQLVE